MSGEPARAVVAQQPGGELADVLCAATAGFGVRELAEPGGAFEGGATQPAGQPGTSTAAQGQADRLRYCSQAAGPAAITGGQARHLLSERDLRTGVVAAEEPAALQMNEDFLAAARGIGHGPLIARALTLGRRRREAPP